MWFQTNYRTPTPHLAKAVAVPIVPTEAKAEGRRRIALVLDKAASVPSIQVVDGRRLTITASGGAGLRAATEALLRLLDSRFARYGYDGLFKQFPWQCGQLGPDSRLFRRRGWKPFLALMQARYEARRKRP